MKPTPYEDVNEVLHSFTKRLVSILGDNLVGLYLTGSLSYSDFNPESSDIDLVVVLKKPFTQEVIESIKKLHLQIGNENKKWEKRLECSYVSVDMLHNILPPELLRPYFGEGTFYPEAPYGSEWLINNYLLFHHGMALIGPEFKTLVKPIDIVDVQEACVRDLFKEWEPKINDSEYLNNSHYQSYVVLNVCRILYTVMSDAVATKKVSAAWVKNEFKQWKNLIETAEKWRYGVEMKLEDETRKFIKFVIGQVNEKRLQLGKS